MAATWTYPGLTNLLLTAGLDWAADTIMCALLPSTWVLDLESVAYWADVSADEVTGSGYTAGGVTVLDAAIVADGSTVGAGCSGPAFTAVTVDDVTYAMFYKATGSDATSPLLAVIVYDTPVSVAADDLVVPVPAAGLFLVAGQAP